MYDALNFYLLVKTVNEEGETVLTLIKSDGGVISDEITPIPVPRDGVIRLCAETSREGDEVTFYQAWEEEPWKRAGEAMSTSLVTDEHCRGFTGAHFGMYVHDLTGLGIYADFKRFSLVF